MNDASWRRLLSQIRDGQVVPVLGPQVLGGEGRESLQHKVAEKLARDYGLEVAQGDLPACREVNEVISRLGAVANQQDLYADVDAAIRELTADDAVIPATIQQIAEISDFRLLVTLTPDDMLARCLRRRCAVNEIIHAPRLPTSELRDLPPNWRDRPGEAHLLYLFGKSRSVPVYAIHDEDLLEYAHNIIARGSQVPTRFLAELQERRLLLFGCGFPDWLSRFFLRITNKTRLSEKDKPDWLIEPHPEASLTSFLHRHSRSTEVLSEVQPADFIAELHRRWMAEHGAGSPPETAEREALARGAMFFVSYSRQTDLARAVALVQALREMGVGEGEVWFDRESIEPGNDFKRRILDGIEACRYFLPLLSQAAICRQKGFVFREWRKAEDCSKEMRGEFVFPIIVDPEYEPQRYTSAPVRAWAGIDLGHAPEGRPDERTAEKLKSLVREARRGRA